MTAMTKDEADRIINAIWRSFQSRCNFHSSWEPHFRAAAMNHLLPPPKLEWSFKSGWFDWRTDCGGYRVSVMDDGMFRGFCWVKERGSLTGLWMQIGDFHATFNGAVAACKNHAHSESAQ